MYYDRQGKRITLAEWTGLHQSRNYVQVSNTILPDGSRLSTVWLGLDHGWFGGPPLIFETMRFAADEQWSKGEIIAPFKFHPAIEFPWEGERTEQVRYSTEEQAISGHNQIVASIEHELEK